MSTTGPAAPPIGIIGLPDLASVCAEIGLLPIYDDHGPTAVADIQQHLGASGAFPVLVAASALPDVAQWINLLAEQTHVVVVTNDPSNVDLEGVRQGRVPLAVLPSTVGAVLATAGYSGVQPHLAAIALDEHANRTDTAAARHTDAPVAPHEPGTNTTTQHQADEQPTAAVEVLPFAAPIPMPEAHDFPTATAADIAPPAPVEAPRPAPSAPHGDTDKDADTIAELSGPSPVVVVWSGKGGVGKSTTAFALAQRAGQAGLKTVLIDANIGQGDVRTILRAGSAGLPSVYQAALSGDPAQAVVSDAQVNASRPLKLEKIAFSVVQAPPPHIPDPDAVTPEVYRKVVAHCRAHFDIVIVDTQIVETIDRFGMLDNFLAPLLLTTRSWGLGLSDSSSLSTSNLLTRLKVFAHLGAEPQTQLSMLNRVHPSVAAEVAGIAGAFTEHSVYLGTLFDDPVIAEHVNRGRPVANIAAYAAILDPALMLVTGDQARFGVHHDVPIAEPKKASRTKGKSKTADTTQEAAPIPAPVAPAAPAAPSPYDAIDLPNAGALHAAEAPPAKKGKTKAPKSKGGSSDSFFLRLFKRG